MSRKDDGAGEIAVPAIGPILNAARTSRRLTLARVAQASGVSQSMLSQIERGQANPTFAVLLSLVRALEIDLEDIVGWSREDDGDTRTELLSHSGTPQIHSRDGTCRLEILSPPKLAGEIEWYRLAFQARGALESEPHAAGTHEHLTAVRGRLIVRSGDSRMEVGEGETVRYSADVRHAIENGLDEPAEAILFVLFANRSAPMWERGRIESD